MKKVRVYFVDFWDGFDFYDNIFYILVSFQNWRID